MSHLIDKLNYFRKKREPFSNGHGETHEVSREWEDSYRQRWQHDKIVRSPSDAQASDEALACRAHAVQ